MESATEVTPGDTTLPLPPLPPSPSAATWALPLLVPTSPTGTLPPATTGLTLLELSTLPRGRLRPMLRLRLIPTMAMAMALVATPMEDTYTAVDTPALDIPDSDTAVATSEDMATVTVVATDTTVKSAKPKDQHNAALP